MEQKNQLSLGNCTKERCLRCDFGYILKDFVKPIMQCLTNDIKDYYMRLLVTKCLNQSVLMAYFMLGKKGIKLADACDTTKVQQRHEAGEDSNAILLESLKKDLLYKRCKYRYLYYILMTDAEFPHDDGNARNFPGHVFIIEKIPNLNGDPTFMFHQAYINAYDYKGHIKRNNNSLSMSYKQISDMVEQINYVLLSPKWDSESVKYWKKITFVNTSNMLGANSGGKMFLCYRKARITDCVNRLETYTTKKLQDISKLKVSELNNIYGDNSLYDQDQGPLTNAEMKKNLEKLLQMIKNNTSKIPIASLS